tara:strand:+ start:1210 stop:1413 length:204 start_codon:yes stop_codon:yes gene_type:complete
MTTEYKVSVHYDEGTILYIDADSPEQAQEKAEKILLDEASVSYSSDYSPDVVHRDYMVVECEKWEGG